MPSTVAFTATTVVIRPWPDDVIDQLGFDPRSVYVERFWLGLLGPSTTWLMRRLVAGFDADPDGYELDLCETAKGLGLGDRGGRNSPFLRSLSRTVQFGLAQPAGGGELAVRRRLPPLNMRQVARLSPALQAAHHRWQEDQLGEPPGEAQRRRARQLALSLLELGEDFDATERQLMHWRYHPTVTREALAWAWEQHVSADEAARAG